MLSKPDKAPETAANISVNYIDALIDMTQDYTYRKNGL